MSTRLDTQAFGSLLLGHLMVAVADVYLLVSGWGPLASPCTEAQKLTFRLLLAVQLGVHLFFGVRAGCLLHCREALQDVRYAFAVHALWFGTSGFVLFAAYNCADGAVIYMLVFGGTCFTVGSCLVEYSTRPHLVEQQPSYAFTQERAGEAPDAAGCSVCLEEFVPGITFGRLRCRHRFHQACIAVWLRDHGTCPLCRGIA